MTKKSLIERNKKNYILSKRYYVARSDLKKLIISELDQSKKRDLIKKLDVFPRNSSATRYKNRCNLTGRARAFIGYFGLSRISFRELASWGLLPGVVKSS
jgi:small subunit ribosomal protein S14